MCPPADESRTPFDAFLAAFRADIDAGAVRPLAEYLARFPGAERTIAREFLAAADGAEPGRSAADRIAHYRILREIGRGGQGIVYVAEDTRLHRQVALKVLDIGPAATTQAIERFRREAAITSKLDHPGICPVYDIGQERSVLYIAMRYVEGETLASRIDSAQSSGEESIAVDFEADATPERRTAKSAPPTSTPPRITETLAIFEQVARALHAAHEHGVIHRDIKPGNIMVTSGDVPVILDFGLAQETDGGDMSLTITGDMTGTPAYMSPEQLFAQRIRLDRRTDVYSLGVTLYEALTLRRPFEAPTREGLYKQILTKDPPDARTLNRGISSDLAVVIGTALEKDQDRRYQTALDLAEELRRVRMHEPIMAKPVGPMVRLARWAQRNPGLATAVGGLFAVLAIGLAVALFLLGQRDRALGEKANALADYDRLGDLSRLQQLVAEADGLWPCEPGRIPGMRDWLARASDLEKRLPGHEEVLARLRPSGIAAVSASRSSATETGSPSHPTWQFKNPAEQFQHDTTAKLVADLTAFVDPEPHKGLLADVRARLLFAESVQRETIGKYETNWADAIRSIADRKECPKYEGLQIRPQLGLIPIGKDPASGLWEFGHLQTATPGTDPIPKRGAGNRLIVEESTGLVLVLLPGGTFQMGAIKPLYEDSPMTEPNVDPEAEEIPEGPVTPVTLEPFFLSKYEMTQGQWLGLVGRNPNGYGPGTVFGGNIVGLTNPVENVSWEDCDLWLGRLGLLLPTEAQWEHGARGGTTTPRWTGIGTGGLDKAANVADAFCRGNGGPSSWRYESWNDGHTVHAPVGTFAPNPFGLHDVLGNVAEWCRDLSGSYVVAPRPGDGLRNPPASRLRVYRGGSFGNDASLARSAVRSDEAPVFHLSTLGVRPARTLDR